MVSVSKNQSRVRRCEQCRYWLKDVDLSFVLKTGWMAYPEPTVELNNAKKIRSDAIGART